MEGEEIPSGGGRGDPNTRSLYPTGFHFHPKDKELVEFYLLPKLQGRPIANSPFVIEADVYECDPEILTNRYKDRGRTQWHFLSPRTRKYQRGIRPSRRTADDRGRWKASTGMSEKKKESEEEEEAAAVEKFCGNCTIKYCMNTLAYNLGPPEKETKTKWLMHEITIPAYETKMGDGNMVLDRYAMCTVYISPLKKWHKDDDEDEDTSIADEEEASSSSTSELALIENESGQGSAAAPATSSKQAGKRPIVENPPLGRAATTKRARETMTTAGGRCGPPAPSHGNGGGGVMEGGPLGDAGAPLGDTGAPLGVGGAATGRLFATAQHYYGQQQPQIPWPPVSGNRLQRSIRLQAPFRLPQVQQQQMRYQYQHNGRQQVPPYHGQATGLAGSSQRLQPPPVSALNSGDRRTMMAMRPPSPSGFEQTKMRPQKGAKAEAAGQRPPLPPAPQPQRQMPEVDLNDPSTIQVLLQSYFEMKTHNALSCTAPNLMPPPPQQPTFDDVARMMMPPPQQQQQPTFDDVATSLPARADDAAVPYPHPVPRGGAQQQQEQRISSPAVPATARASVPDWSVPLEEPTPVRTTIEEAARDSDIDELFASLATMTTIPCGKRPYDEH